MTFELKDNARKLKDECQHMGKIVAVVRTQNKIFNCHVDQNILTHSTLLSLVCLVMKSVSVLLMSGLGLDRQDVVTPRCSCAKAVVSVQADGVLHNLFCACISCGRRFVMGKYWYCIFLSFF